MARRGRRPGGSQARRKQGKALICQGGEGGGEQAKNPRQTKGLGRAIERLKRRRHLGRARRYLVDIVAGDRFGGAYER